MKTVSEKENKGKKICVVGIGNTLRSDDGVGALVCSELEKFKTPGVSVFSMQQLHVDLIEDFKDFDTIIVVDAGTGDKDVSIYPVEEGKLKSIPSSHHIDAALLYALSQKLYPSERHFFLCAIRGESFKFGGTLSESAINNASKAVKLLEEFIKGKAA